MRHPLPLGFGRHIYNSMQHIGHRLYAPSQMCSLLKYRDYHNTHYAAVAVLLESRNIDSRLL